MACYHPLIAWARPSLDGKKEIAFCNSEWDKDKKAIWRDGKYYGERLELPCGQCVGCRLAYARNWAVRCVLEAQQYEYNYFVTLTYNDENLPCTAHYRFDKETGEVTEEFESHPLQPDDLTKFMKDLRRYYSYHYNHEGIRFFACGEYGDKKGRPHYHLILFNCPIPDLQDDHRNALGNMITRSPSIEKIWGKGLVGIGEVNFQSASYTARYMMKKHKGRDSQYYEQNGLVPEFNRVSRRPGLAKTYYDENRDKIYRYDEIIITGGDGKALKVKPPGYYDRLYDIDYPDTMEKIKEKRRAIATANRELELEQTSLDNWENLAVKEGNKLLKIKSLVRPLD